MIVPGGNGQRDRLLLTAPSQAAVEQGWEELGEYEFRGTEEQWTALEQEATTDWKKSMERLGWEFIEDSKNDIAHVKLGESKNF